MWDALVQVQAWVLEDFAALAEKEWSEPREGLAFLWMSSLQLCNTECSGMDSPAVPLASTCPQPGHGEVIKKKLPKGELGKLCERSLILGVASVAMGYCLFA